MTEFEHLYFETKARQALQPFVDAAIREHINRLKEFQQEGIPFAQVKINHLPLVKLDTQYDILT